MTNNNAELLNILYKERLNCLTDIKTLNNMLNNAKTKLAEITDKISELETSNDIS